jgi:hypothetical protein
MHKSTAALGPQATEKEASPVEVSGCQLSEGVANEVALGELPIPGKMREHEIFAIQIRATSILFLRGGSYRKFQKSQRMTVYSRFLKRFAAWNGSKVAIF